MKDWYIIYYNNKTKKFHSEYYSNITKKEAVNKFCVTHDTDEVIINIINL